ncbi:MAG: beta-galactosidase [Kiritimatiellae bacterium]|nr:beta-galactosidase [Kiritimatiellia bacterium]
MKSIMLLSVVAVSFAAAAAEPAFDTLIAHSGGSDAPKNTAAAFRDSVVRGFGIECDVRLSGDGRLFTFHDDTLARLTDGANTNAIYKMTWNEIAKLNVAGEKWRGTGFDPARPALFEEEVLPLARDGRWLFVEVKPEAGIEVVPHLKKALARQRKATPKNTLFISFSGDICKELKKQMPEYKALYLTTVYIGGKRYNRYKDPRNLIADLKAMGVDGVDAPFYNKKSMNLQTAEYIKTVKDAGFEYHAWTCNSLDQVRTAFERGMDTVTTDLPETILREYRADKVKLDTSADRVKTPLVVDMERIGTLRPRSVGEIRGSNWTLGCETLDRDFAVFDEYKRFLAPLGIKTIRLQAGWAKCEREKGKYDFAWLDRIIDYVRAQGINVLLETGYGNPVYKGGGGHDLAGGFPTSDEALAAWDAWVDAMTKRFKGRVRDWAMWNEPDIGGNKTVKDIVAFNIRTARIVKRNIPDARIAGLSLARNNPGYFEKCLAEMGPDVALFDWFIYHGYAPAPESSYENVEMQKAVLAKYSPKARMRQGENGCPSEMATKFTLSGIPWSEYSQAKWDMRRMLGDLGHDVESSVFTICDFNHRGKEVNLKGLLRASFGKEVIAVKRAYYAVQNVAGLFDDSLERVRNSRFGTRDATLSTYEYKKADERRVLVFWTHADATSRQGKEYKPKYKRPGDSFETRPAVLKYPGGKPFKEPVWIDLLTGRVYAFPKKNQIVVSAGVVFLDVPVYDSPCVLTERSVAELGN